MFIERLPAPQVRLRMSRLFFSITSVLTLAAINGCGVKPTPVVGAITVTDAKGVAQTPITSLQHGQAIFLDVVVSNDIEFLGVDWTVTCSSSLPEGSLPPGMVDTSCGTFVPNHTVSGPIPTYPSSGIITLFTAPGSIPKAGTVTIVAHATSAPAVTSSITLQIT